MEIEVKHLSKIFANGKGIFDLNFTVKQGEVFGYLGPNGAGKSTTIRHLMGFLKPSKGKTLIHGRNCWKDAAKIKENIGYLPGEIAFLEGMTGLQFLKLLAGMRGMKDVSYRDELLARFHLDAKTPIRKMSKGMKQKVGIVAAFMHNPDILILDEPTSGLDPLMQRIFIELILEEKAAGKTILLSSHSFQEIERTCDRAGIIKDGRLITIEDVHHLQSMQRKLFEVTLKSHNDVEKMKQSRMKIENEEGLRLQIPVQGDYDQFVEVLSRCQVNSISVYTQDLEEVFMKYYDKKEPSTDSD